MAPERRNTAKLNLDLIASIRGIFGSVAHAYSMLSLEKVGMPMRRLNLALNHNFITPDESWQIETHWNEWAQLYLHKSAHTVTDFTLPDELLARVPSSRY